MMNYDESFDPPAPIAKIALRNIETGERVKDLSVLLDTGADISLLPLSAINQLQIEPSDETVNLIGFDESKSTAEIYHLQIIFLGKRLTGVYCAIDDEIGILGRDVLNQFSVIFDGRNLEWKEQG
jgi:predicted aspartyl protease